MLKNQEPHNRIMKRKRDVDVPVSRGDSPSDDDKDDMDIDPPTIVVTPAEQYRMTPAALKYHQMIKSKPKISVIRPAKKQQSVLDFI